MNESLFQFKSNLYHYTLAAASEAARDRLQETSIEFADCVQQLLKATQVLTYAWRGHAQQSSRESLCLISVVQYSCSLFMAVRKLYR